MVTGYTPYELVYGLHPLMLTKYVLLVISGDHIDVEPTRVLTTRIIKLEKLHEKKLEAQNNVGINQWNFLMWNQQKNIEKVSIWTLCFMVSQRKKDIWANSKIYGLVHSRYNIAYPIILFFLFMLIILNQI